MLLPFAAHAGTNAVACVPSDPANVKFIGMGWQITKPGIYTLTCPSDGAMYGHYTYYSDPGGVLGNNSIKVEVQSLLWRYDGQIIRPTIPASCSGGSNFS